MKNNKHTPSILIFNPNAGVKRNMGKKSTNLEEIESLLNQYQIPFELTPTKKPGDAEIFAREAAKKGAKTVLVAGGDGTVGEAASGLVGTNTELGIIPIGSFMNTAKMLSVPFDLEKAVAVIKIGRVRKIDVGVVQELSDSKKQKHYFLESAGIGLEAIFHKHFGKFEKGNKKELIAIVKSFFNYDKFESKIFLDDREIEVKTHLITVSNGPLSGASLNMSPLSKLNDHRLTVSVYKMSKFQIVNFLFNTLSKQFLIHPQISSFQAQKVRIETKPKIRIHADSRFFSQTPVEFTILPSALSAISGFPKEEDTSLLKRTQLDP